MIFYHIHRKAGFSWSGTSDQCCSDVLQQSSPGPKLLHLYFSHYTVILWWVSAKLFKSDCSHRLLSFTNSFSIDREDVLSREVGATVPSPAHGSLGPDQLQYKTSPEDSCFPQLPLGRTVPAHPARPWGPPLIMPFYKASQSPSWFISRLLRKVAKGVSANNKGPLFVRRLQSQMGFL